MTLMILAFASGFYVYCFMYYFVDLNVKWF